MKINIAIIGLGRVGSVLLQKLITFKNKGINILAVAEPENTPGKIVAMQKKIKLSTLEEIVEMNNNVDIIFELTGSKDVRRYLRDLLFKKNNKHTVIATETIGTLICLVLTDKTFPDVHKHKGY